jgi:PTS system fructose-specific IIA component
MLISKELIILNLDIKDKNDVIYKLACLAEEAGKIISMEDYFNDVLAREISFTTGIGNGIAIPHGKSNSVEETIVVFAKLKKAIDWNSLDDRPVDIVFLLGIPNDNTDNLHLKILAQLSRKLMNEDFVNSLRSAITQQEVFELLADIGM